ncbi:cobalt-precorrin-6A reductase [Rhodococcus sp. H29-C3]|uniref:cobalt-precorrin-6A reductase n=1 Tax=Rhodococcus sp. H29-C3 TaxID=3046307 RepID=UPI0024B94F2C|nr:cobalt-precorrin-6A reductase [Rhodococcus sp. H29-C3]MDJ0362185.1 cobalt-precorrin-6A reductase [Rhodococcus sp. H29-C3]
MDVDQAVRVLVLGGTSESRELAARLSGDDRFDFVTSLAGRVRDPKLPLGTSRVGGFGGADGLTRWLHDHEIDAMVDATHPFASTISNNAAIAAARFRIPLLGLHRTPWSSRPGDQWLEVFTPGEAAAAIPADAGRVLLTIGRQEVAAFAAVESSWFLIRSIDPPDPVLPIHHELLLARGPFDIDAEIELMRRRGIDAVVSKNSGGVMTEAKITAARELGIPVIMIARPTVPPDRRVVHTVDDVLAWLDSLSG